MPAIVLDKTLIKSILKKRRALGNRTGEEVWDGVTYIMPQPDNVHEDIAVFFGSIFSLLFGLGKQNRVQGRPNISDRVRGWKKNFRNPDMAYYPAGTAAVDCGTHWCGGPDFLLEIISPDDMSRDKLPFYASVGTREVFVLDRDPWQLELYQLRRGRLRLAGTARPGEAALASHVVPLTFALVRGRPRPKIRITHAETGQDWTF